MREGFRRDAAAAHALDAVVANRGGGAKTFLEIAGFEASPLGGVVAPDAGETIGLQFLLHGHRIRVRAPRSQFFAAIEHAKKVLHVVSDLVRNDVRLRKIAGIGGNALVGGAEYRMGAVETFQRGAAGAGT